MDGFGLPPSAPSAPREASMGSCNSYFCKAERAALESRLARLDAPDIREVIIRRITDMPPSAAADAIIAMLKGE